MVRAAFEILGNVLMFLVLCIGVHIASLFGQYEIEWLGQHVVWPFR